MRFNTLPAALLLALAAVAPADSVVMNDGRTLEGEILREDDASLQLRIKGGKVTLRRADVKSVEHSATKPDAAPQDPVAQRFAATGTPAVDAARSKALELFRAHEAAAKVAGKEAEAARAEMDGAQRDFDALTGKRKSLCSRVSAGWDRYMAVVKACGG